MRALSDKGHFDWFAYPALGLRHTQDPINFNFHTLPVTRRRLARQSFNLLIKLIELHRPCMESTICPCGY